MTDDYYMVEFLGVKSPSILQRVFSTKEEAAVYKSEHELGKFAAVISVSSLSVYQIYLQEILNVLGEQPDKTNPLGFMGCLYEKENPEPTESKHCVIGQHLFDYGIDLGIDPKMGNPFADTLYNNLFAGKLPDAILENLAAAAQKIQSFADRWPHGELPTTWANVMPFVVNLMEGN